VSETPKRTFIFGGETEGGKAGREKQKWGDESQSKESLIHNSGWAWRAGSESGRREQANRALNRKARKEKEKELLTQAEKEYSVYKDWTR